MSLPPPHDPRFPNQGGYGPPLGGGPYRPGPQDQPQPREQGGYPRPGYQQGGYPEPEYQPGYQQQGQYREEPRQAARPAQQRQAQAPQRQAPQPSRSSGPRRIPGVGLVLAIVGSLVQLLSLTLLPWVAHGGDPKSLVSLVGDLSDGQPHGFGDWYVVLFSYPLVVLGVLLSFSAVLESVAMKVVWAGLVLLGVGFLLLRFGVGPMTGLFGVEQDFSTRDVVVAVAAVGVAVVVIFVLKTAVSMFRRVAGLILLALSGVHVAAVADLADGFSNLSVGSFGPVVGYLLIGVAALVGPKRFAP
ncbi:hypothetical protein [Actinokineospora globicatena]|uniref:Uncharacterized protein n=1 Tax=Actinokineospora globicatena TaxID=103729 RepID=A0A9W6QHB5_9PSEU|nr:hypothetical protein [Actinokineospora globicatena]GLW89382.1 hypothetical protein Aglo03_01980 [Actinokineospora globicatena]